MSLGPKIIRDESLADYADEQRSAAMPRTGIRQTNTGGWAAVRDGRLINTYEGIGAKRSAILAAGSNTVVA